VLQSSDLDFIRKLSVFAGISREVVDNVGAKAQRMELRAGELLFKEGEPAKEMLLVISGRLEVVKRADLGGEAIIAVLGPGDVVGEMSLIDIQPRSAEVRAVEDSSVVVLSHGDIATIYHEDPKSYTLLVLNIAREISLRLRRLDKLVANVMVEIRDATSARVGAPASDKD
jgi:CRP-like cAMP-binding protein